MELETHVDQLRLRLASLMDVRLGLLSERVAGFRRRLVSPGQQIRLWRFQLQENSSRLMRSWNYYREQKQSICSSLAARLDLLSPLKTLDRGYAIVLRKDGKAVLDSRHLTPGDLLDVKFSVGEAKVEVKGSSH